MSYPPTNNRQRCLLLCLAINTVLLLLLQHSATLIFANKAAIKKDTSLTASGGAALGVHTIVEDCNPSDIDAIVGYSSQLHALTNIPIQIERWRAVLWISHFMSLVLIAQASVLASLFGSLTVQV